MIQSYPARYSNVRAIAYMTRPIRSLVTLQCALYLHIYEYLKKKHHSLFHKYLIQKKYVHHISRYIQKLSPFQT